MAAPGELMSEQVFATSPETPVADVASTMVEGRIGSAAVLVGELLIGIFTERDVLRAAAAGGDLSQQPVRNWMTEDPVTATVEVDSEDACETMLAGGFRHLPVVDGTRLVGIVSLRDLLSARIRRS